MSEAESEQKRHGVPVTAPHRLTLPGEPVTAEVTWEQVREYLRAEGWVRRDVHGEPEKWIAPALVPGVGLPCVFVEWAGFSMREAVETLARLAGVAPGTMLARIAAPTSLEPPALGAWRDPDPPDFATRAAERVLRKLYGAGRGTDAERATVAAEVRKSAEDMRNRIANIIATAASVIPQDEPRARFAAMVRALPLDGSR